jgi:hypothetical protein
MKRQSFFYKSMFLLVGVALTNRAYADPIVHNTVFSEVIVIETDVFETSGGTVLFTTNGVGYSDWLSPVIASYLAGDPAVPGQIQSTVSLVTLASEYQFLAMPGPQYLVLDGVGPAIANPFADQNIGFDVGYALAAAGGPAYSIVGGPSATTVGAASHSTSALEPDGSVIEGTVNFAIYAEDIVEQPAAAVPEPSTLPLLGSGLLLILLFARRAVTGSTK